MISLVDKNLPDCWKSRYLQELGIKDHIKELVVIQDEIMRVKNSTELKDVSILTEHYENELTDLFLILSNYLDRDIMNKRVAKFWEKSEGD